MIQPACTERYNEYSVFFSWSSVWQSHRLKYLDIWSKIGQELFCKSIWLGFKVKQTIFVSQLEYLHLQAVFWDEGWPAAVPTASSESESWADFTSLKADDWPPLHPESDEVWFEESGTSSTHDIVLSPTTASVASGIASSILSVSSAGYFVNYLMSKTLFQIHVEETPHVYLLF